MSNVDVQQKYIQLVTQSTGRQVIWE